MINVQEIALKPKIQEREWKVHFMVAFVQFH